MTMSEFKVPLSGLQKGDRFHHPEFGIGEVFMRWSGEAEILCFPPVSPLAFPDDMKFLDAGTWVVPTERVCGYDK